MEGSGQFLRFTLAALLQYAEKLVRRKDRKASYACVVPKYSLVPANPVCSWPFY